MYAKSWVLFCAACAAQEDEEDEDEAVAGGSKLPDTELRESPLADALSETLPMVHVVQVRGEPQPSRLFINKPVMTSCCIVHLLCEMCESRVALSAIGSRAMFTRCDIQQLETESHTHKAVQRAMNASNLFADKSAS